MTCPKAKHFHVICRDVFEKDNFEKVFEVPNANIAFESVIKVLLLQETHDQVATS